MKNASDGKRAGMSKAAKAVLILVLVLLAAFTALWIHTSRMVYIVVENRSDGDIYGARILWKFNDLDNTKTGFSSISAAQHVHETGNNDLVPFAFGETIPFPIRREVQPDTLPEAIPVLVRVELSPTAEYSDGYDTEEVLEVPVRRGRRSIVVVTGNREDGFHAAYDHMESGNLAVFLKYPFD